MSDDPISLAELRALREQQRDFRARAKPVVPGGSGPHDPGMEARVAVLEEIAKNTAATLKEIREEIRDVRGEVRELRADQRSDFRSLLGIMIAGFGGLLGALTGLLGVMAHGFHWL
ncbi:MAG: hypothetical protein JO264_17050 [Acidisphaera sp.]|nr:hypothetical protein [Acidisphaera sp.]